MNNTVVCEQKHLGIITYKYIHFVHYISKICTKGIYVILRGILPKTLLQDILRYDFTNMQLPYPLRYSYDTHDVLLYTEIRYVTTVTIDYVTLLQLLYTLRYVTTVAIDFTLRYYSYYRLYVTLLQLLYTSRYVTTITIDFTLRYYSYCRLYVTLLQLL